MIIGKEYDDSLWCMVLSNKKNSKEIISFMKELPKEVLDFARDRARDYLNCGLSEDEETEVEKELEEDDASVYDYSLDDEDLLYVECPNDSTQVYCTTINRENGAINIQKRLMVEFRDGVCWSVDEKLFEVTIIPMMKDYKGLIGDMTSVDDKYFQYVLLPNEEKTVVKSFRPLCETYAKPRYVELDLNAIPDDLNMGDFPLRLRRPRQGEK